jgi:hypothetical protein
MPARWRASLDADGNWWTCDRCSRRIPVSHCRQEQHFAHAIKGHQSTILCDLGRHVVELRDEGWAETHRGRLKWFFEVGVPVIDAPVLAIVETRSFVPAWAAEIADATRGIRAPQIRKRMVAEMARLAQDDPEEFAACLTVLDLAGVQGLAKHLFGYVFTPKGVVSGVER